MKTLHLVSSGGYYGKEAVIVNLCAALEKLGCATEGGAFLNSSAPNDEVVTRAHRQHLPARMFACDGRVDPRTVRAIREHILAQQVDLVHTHDYKADLYGYLAARWAGRPVFATCHLWSCTTMRERFYAGLDRFVLKHFDGVIAVSPPIGTTLQKSWVPQDKVAVIANGIDLSPLLAVGEGPPRREFGSELVIGMSVAWPARRGMGFYLPLLAGFWRNSPEPGLS
jgi:glycosyltransferase involved in cell wall biosynthesis